MHIDAHILHPKATHKTSIIWLHGLGSDGFDFAPIVPELNLNSDEIKFIFPHAPIRPITINNGFPMRGWYDIFTLDPNNFTHDMEGIRASAEYVHGLIDAEIKAGIPAERIILAGFSQGGAIALFAGLTAKVKVGGILALSTYLPASDVVAIEKEHENPAILMIHGSEDMTIRLEYAELSRDALIEMGCNIEFMVYPMAHTLCADEVTYIGQWLKKITAPLAGQSKALGAR